MSLRDEPLMIWGQGSGKIAEKTNQQVAQEKNDQQVGEEKNNSS